MERWKPHWRWWTNRLRTDVDRPCPSYPYHWFVWWKRVLKRLPNKSVRERVAYKVDSWSKASSIVLERVWTATDRRWSPNLDLGHYHDCSRTRCSSSRRCTDDDWPQSDCYYDLNDDSFLWIVDLPPSSADDRRWLVDVGRTAVDDLNLDLIIHSSCLLDTVPNRLIDHNY